MNTIAQAAGSAGPAKQHGMARLFLAVLIARATCDPVFEAIKPESGGGMGLGAIVNLFMLVVAARYYLRRPRAIGRAVAPMWLPFLFAALVSTALAPSFSSSARLFLVQLSYCAVFAIPFYLVRSPADVRPCLHAIVLSSLIPAAFGLAQLMLQGGWRGGEEYRISATFSHPNIFGFYLVLIMATILYLQRASGGPTRPALRRALWLYTMILLALLVCTKTRSAWAGPFMVFGLYGMFHRRRLLLYVLLVPALLMLDPAVRERLADLGSNNESPTQGNVNSFAWRLLLWKAGLNWMDNHHTGFGYGLDSFKFYSPRFFPLEGPDTWDPHNVYVQLFFEAGVAGLATYAWLFARLTGMLRTVHGRDREGATILFALVFAYVVTSASDNMLYYLSYNWYFWFLMGAVCAGHRSANARP
ncbi:MAG: O-antigen ligase family protein [Massilia sp.]